MQSTSLKITSGITALLLLLCLVHFPYGYYLFVRFVAMIVFAVLALNYLSSNSKPLGVLFVALAILFQPFFKIALGRELWNVIDVICALLLIGLIFFEKKSK